MSLTTKAPALRQTAAGRKLDTERAARKVRREAIAADPIAAVVASTKTAKATKRPGFFEEESVIIDRTIAAGAPRPRPVPAPAEKEFVRVMVIGSRVQLVPSGLYSALALAAARAEFDHKVDAKKKARIFFFDRVLRRGATNWKPLLAMLRLKGIEIEIDQSAERAVAAYGRHLSRQLTPIERTVWRDAEIDYTQIEEADL